jgi:hypothetical protein
MKASGTVDVQNGKLFLNMDTPWHLEMNELGLAIFEAESQKVCAIFGLATRMIRLEGYLEVLAQQVWK